MLPNNQKLRDRLTESSLKYYQLDTILGISEATRCRMLRKELPEAEQDRICKMIDAFLESEQGADRA